MAITVCSVNYVVWCTDCDNLSTDDAVWQLHHCFLELTPVCSEPEVFSISKAAGPRGRLEVSLASMGHRPRVRSQALELCLIPEALFGNTPTLEDRDMDIHT
eukprot:3280328-Amphidinium_carterae.1